MRAALFNPVTAKDTEKIGHLAESAIFSQWQHSSTFKRLRYARWKNEGEVDIVFLGPAEERPLWLGEIKWSDRVANDPDTETRNLRYLMSKHPRVTSAFITTKTFRGTIKGTGSDLPITAIPSALHCYRVGRNITTTLDIQHALGEIPEDQRQGTLFASSSPEV